MNINGDDPDDEPTEQEVENHLFVQLMQEKADIFDKLCQDRHAMGQEEYGAFTFLENDVVRMMIEELADTSNYCRYHAVKLLLLSEQVSAKLMGQFGEDDDIDIKIGVKAFRGTGEVGWGDKK